MIIKFSKLPKLLLLPLRISVIHLLKINKTPSPEFKNFPDVKKWMNRIVCNEY